MICQRCGFELEAGQTFCGMCGTEQSRALRKKKWSPKSILWLISVVSKSHFKMWLVFIATLIMSVCVLAFMDFSAPLTISSLCLNILLVSYELFYVLLGYKNPNATKTKAYKIKYKICLILAVLLTLFTLFLDFPKMTTAIHNFIVRCR